MIVDKLIIEAAYLSPEMIKHLDIPIDENAMKAKLEYIRLAELGLTISEFVSNNRQTDFVRHEFDSMVSRMEAHIADLSITFTKQVDQAMASQFDQANAMSYIARWHDAMRSNLENFIHEIKAMSDKANETQKLVVENAARVSTDKVTVIEGLFRNADVNFDPANTNGYFGKFRQLIADIDVGMRQQLDRNFKTGFAGQLDSALQTYFGPLSPVLGSMDQLLAKYLQTMQADIAALRESIARKEGEADMLKKASIKGGVFEDEIAQILEPIAKVDGDVYGFIGNDKVNGSKKGDFIYTVGKNTIVVEAKDTPVGTKAMLRYMEEAMTVRGAEFGILCTRNLDQMEKQVGGMNVYGNVLFCHVELLPLALRWVKLYLTKIKGEEASGVNANAVRASLTAVMTTMKSAAQVKQKLTAIRGNVNAETEAIATLMDEMKANVTKELEKIESEIGKG